MTGFFVLDVPEFASLITAAQKAASCVVHPLTGGYRFVEFNNEIEIRRSDTQMNEAVWFGCLTAGLIGKISRFDKDIMKLVATNEPIVM